MIAQKRKEQPGYQLEQSLIKQCNMNFQKDLSEEEGKLNPKLCNPKRKIETTNFTF